MHDYVLLACAALTLLVLLNLAQMRALAASDRSTAPESAAPEPAKEVELDAARYTRWLRACRPPLPWFLALSEAEQETLAGLAEAWQQDILIAAGWAIRDPEAAALGVRAQAGDAAAEDELLRRAMAAQAPRGRAPIDSLAAQSRAVASAPLEAVAASRPACPEDEALGMGGVTERRRARETGEADQVARMSRLFGAPPTGVAR